MAKQNESIGRNPIYLDISDAASKFVGILINRGYCSGVFCDLKLNILKSERIVFDEFDQMILLKKVCLLADHMMEGANRIGGIGIASVGPVDAEHGVILNPPNFYGIKYLR